MLTTRLARIGLMAMIPFFFHANAALAVDSCESGTVMTGAAPPDGTERGCQKRDKSGEYVRHGPWTEWYLNGQKQKAGKYVDGLRQGVWTWWYPNGKRMQEGRFWDDKPVGIWEFWDENGKSTGTKEQVFVKPSGEEELRSRPKMDDFSRNLNRGFKKK